MTRTSTGFSSTLHIPFEFGRNSVVVPVVPAASSRCGLKDETKGRDEAIRNVGDVDPRHAKELHCAQKAVAADTSDRVPHSGQFQAMVPLYQTNWRAG